MKLIKTLAAAIAIAFGAGMASTAAAQTPACQTPVGVFPMPGGIPQPGLPCFGPAGAGFTIIIGGGMPGGFPGGMPGGFPGGMPGGFPGGMPGGFPGGMPGGFPAGMPGGFPGGMPGPGVVVGALGGNREMQLAAECSNAGHPKAIAACIASRLTQAEMEKCKQGIGTPNGCFGPNNTIRVHLENSIKDLTQGPGRSNDLVGRDGFTCQKLGVCL